MTQRPPRKAATDTPDAPPRPSRNRTYVAGSHTASIKAEHDQRRTELLARDEVLASEIKTREDERHDISEALRLMSDPGPAKANVEPIRQPIEVAA